MRRLFFMAVLLPFLLCSCMTRIVTVSPDAVGTGIYNNGAYGNRTYSTTVTVPKKHTVTTTRVTAVNEDISLYLDLQAVAAAFAQSANIDEFERLLNNASYMLSNLDLNRDGYIDYLRVLETVEGRAHVFLIQAVLAANIFQDVATVVAEVAGTSSAYVQIIGSSYIYGPNFIVQPVYIVTPPIFAHLCRPAYQPWRSPWYWGHFPSYYKRPAPIFLNHYQAYVHTFMTNHVYCHEVTYLDKCHYPDYDRVSRPIQRNDYGQQHPEQSFTQRFADQEARTSINTGTGNASSARVVNARDVIERQAASREVTTSSTRTRQTSTTTRQAVPATQTTSRSQQSAQPSSQSQSSSRTATTSSRNQQSAQPSSQGQSSSRTATTSSRNQQTTQPATQSQSSSRTSTTSSRNQQATQQTTQQATQSSSSSRTATQSTSRTAQPATQPATKPAASSTRQSQPATQPAQPTQSRQSSSRASSRDSQTTVSSRVSTSGTSETRIKTVSSSGETSTVKRGSDSQQSSTASSRSAGSTTSSRGAGGR